MGHVLDRKGSVAQQVRRRVLRSDERLWRIEDFEGSPSAVNNELRRLISRGELVRVRRGVYWRGKKSRFGMIGASQGEAVQKLFGAQEAIGATGWHATNLLGLSTQVSPVEALAVTHRRPDGLHNVKISSRAARSGRREAKLNGMEVTFLEALEGWDRYVEADGATALERFGELLDREDVRVERLVRASRTEPPVVRERLRAVLRHGGYEEQAERVPAARDPRTRARALRVLGGTAA
ncbi:MAG TPA: DUF6088 family protein [Solirubrobacteraceae bacterium]